MIFSFPVILLAALVPMILGMIWYHKKVFGTAWMASAGVTEENAKGANMFLIFGLSYVFCVFIAMSVNFMVIHQSHLASIVLKEPGFGEEGAASTQWLNTTMESYGKNFRTWSHGLFHGAFAGIFIALPLIGINALFERKNFKYIAINAGYWIVSLMLMGGIICAYT